MRRVRLVVGKLRDALKSAVYGPDLPGGINDEALPFAFQAPHRRGSRQVRSLWHVQF